MAISSIHIEAGSDGFFAHNSRETKTKNSIFSDEENFCSCTKIEAFQTFRTELQKRSEAYTERTGQKLQKNTITHLSAIVNLNAEHTSQDLKLVCDYLEKTLDTKIIQYAIHHDEGHLLNEATDKVRKMHALLTEDDKIKNYHAHIEFLGLDTKGASVRKKLTKKFLSELQTKVAELLKMERGSDSMITNLPAYYEQVRDEMPRTDNLADFKKEWIETSKKIRYRDKPKAKRKSTQHYKTAKEQEAEIAKQKDLKTEIALLKAELQEQKATREDYAQLEQINKDLKQKIKNKDLTIDDLQKMLINGREMIFSQEAIIDTQKTKLELLEQDIAVLEAKNNANLGLNTKIKNELEKSKQAFIVLYDILPKDKGDTEKKYFTEDDIISKVKKLVSLNKNRYRQ